MAAELPPLSFYTHTTDLQVARHVSLRSNILPGLELRTPQLEDANALLVAFTDERNVGQDASADGLNTLPAIEGLIHQWSTYDEPLQRVNNVVSINGEVIGCGGLGWIGPSKSHKGETAAAAGIMINTPQRGKGYAFEGLRMVFDHAFRVLGMHEVRLGTKSENLGFCGLMEGKFKLEKGVLNPKDQFGNDVVFRVWRDKWDFGQGMPVSD